MQQIISDPVSINIINYDGRHMSQISSEIELFRILLTERSDAAYAQYEIKENELFHQRFSIFYQK